MQIRLGLFNTNQVNLNGFAIATEGLVSYVEQTWKTGLPMFVSHDMHRPIGWSSTVGLLIAPEFVGVVGAAHLAESDEDMGRVASAVTNYLGEKLEDVPAHDAERLREIIGCNLSSDAAIVKLAAVSAVDVGIAARLFPDLFTRDADKYALTDLASLKRIGPGVYEKAGLLLFAHRHLRRSMSLKNNLNAEFLTLLAKCAERDDLSVEVALDPDIVALPGTWKGAIELEYWWGPKFKDDLPSITNEVTRHEGDSTLRLFHGINRMEFWWHAQNDIKTLEAEEVLDSPSWGISENHFACRYVHSMLDPKTGTPIHLDGAVRIYDEAMILERMDHSIKTAGRKTDYVKLWRIDGPLDVPLWKSLISDFYRDNRLVGEYFQGEDTVRVEGTERVAEPDPLEEYVSQCIDPTDGAYFLMSYEELDKSELVATVSVQARQAYKREARSDSCIELSALDFIKLLRKRHAGLALPAANLWFAFEDMDMNLPEIFHAGEHAASDATASIRGLQEFVSQLAVNGGQRFVTADLSVAYEDRKVKFSFAGFAAELARLLVGLKPLPPSVAGLAQWCEAAHEAARKEFPKARYSPDHIKLMTPAGSMFIKRKRVAVEPIPGSNTGQHGVQIGTAGALAEAWNAGAIGVAKFYDVRTANCKACQQSYFLCPCTALLGSNTTVQVEDCDLLGYMWTPRPA